LFKHKIIIKNFPLIAVRQKGKGRRGEEKEKGGREHLAYTLPLSVPNPSCVVTSLVYSWNIEAQ
jgi:hypothetical protein